MQDERERTLARPRPFPEEEKWAGNHAPHSHKNVLAWILGP